MNDDLEHRIKTNGAKHGLVLGLILLSLSIFLFYLITAISKSPVIFVLAPTLLSVVIPIACVILFCFNLRKKIGGYWSVRQATTGIFIMFLTAYILQTVGKDIIFDRYIEPQSVQKTQDAAINAKIFIMKQRKDSQATMDKSIAELKKDFDLQKQVTVGNIIQGLVISIIFIFLLALIFGSMYKKEVPLYTNAN